MDDLVKGLFELPVSNLLIVAGLVFLCIAVVGKISGKIDPGKAGRIASGTIGTILLAVGLSMYLGHPAKKPPNPTELSPPRTSRPSVRRPPVGGETSTQLNAGEAFAKAKKYYESRNYSSAFPLAKQAAEAGDREAMYLLSKLYARGLGVSKDGREQIRWLRKAGEAGHTHAMYALGSIYLSGRGIEKNKAEAIRWLEKAAARGHDRAKARLEKLGAGSGRESRVSRSRERASRPTSRQIRLRNNESYHFSTGRRGKVTGGDFYFSFGTRGVPQFWANNRYQRGVVDLGDIGNVDLRRIRLPRTRYSQQGVRAIVGHTYVALAREGEEGNYIVYRVEEIGPSKSVGKPDFVLLAFVYR